MRFPESLRRFAIALGGAAALLLVACGGSGTKQTSAPLERKPLYWYDPMQPATHFDHPGTSPLMPSMDLVPKYADEPPPGGAAPAAGDSIALNSGEIAAAGVRTAPAAVVPLERTIRAVGSVEAPETRLAHVASRVAGRLDRLYADFTGRAVRKGEPLYTIYSPDLLATERELALAVENGVRARASGDEAYARSAEALVAATRERLALWGVPPEEIERLASGGSPETDLVVRSPISGTVLEKRAVAGQYVQEGQDLYVLADLSELWLYVHVYERDLGAIRAGQAATASVAALPSKTFAGRVSFIDPVVDPETRSARVRVELANSGGLLKPGMFANADLHVDLGSRLAIPRSALLDTGTRRLVYVRTGDGRFSAREVRTGELAGDLVEILGGIAAGDEVVAAASFLVDAQSQLQTGASVQWSGASEVRTPNGEKP